MKCIDFHTIASQAENWNDVEYDLEKLIFGGKISNQPLLCEILTAAALFLKTRFEPSPFPEIRKKKENILRRPISNRAHSLFGMNQAIH